MTPRRLKAFTLIELLVVIAIIGILAAMLFPVFARAREAARKTQCLANVKNIAMALQIYLTDYDRFPPHEHSAEFATWMLETSTPRAERSGAAPARGTSPPSSTLPRAPTGRPTPRPSRP